MFSPKTIPPRDKTPFLVRPSVREEGLEPNLLLDDRPDAPESPQKPEDVRAETDLLIKGLMDRLPAPNGTWSLEDRTRWLQTAASIFGLIYETPDSDEREIAIALDGSASKGR